MSEIFVRVAILGPPLPWTLTLTKTRFFIFVHECVCVNVIFRPYLRRRLQKRRCRLRWRFHLELDRRRRSFFSVGRRRRTKSKVFWWPAILLIPIWKFEFEFWRHRSLLRGPTEDTQFLLFSGILSVHARLRKRETVREKKQSYSRAKTAQKKAFVFLSVSVHGKGGP